jgi:hypothetical protein
MKPTLKQQLWLKDYLYQVMNYRETYEEVYDHILAALENKPEAKQFETAVAEVIEEEFGGNNGLMEMEESCKNAVVNDTLKQYWSYWHIFLKFPGILCVTGLFILIHYVRYFGLHVFVFPVFFILNILLLITILLPFVLLITRLVVKKYKFGSTKNTFKDQIFKRIVYRALRSLFLFLVVRAYLITGLFKIFFAARFISPRSYWIIFSAVNEFISTSILIALIIHNLACFKLFKDELKANTVTR